MMYRILILVMLAGLMACQTTGDPTQGGLFGWDPNKSDQRIKQREENLAALRAQQQANQARTTQLSQQKAAKEAKVAKLKKDIARLQTDIAKIKRDIVAFRAQTQEQQQKKAQLEQDLAKLQAQINQVRQDQQMTDEEKQAEVDRLKKEIATLMEMASLLTTQ